MLTSFLRLKEYLCTENSHLFEANDCLRDMVEYMSARYRELKEKSFLCVCHLYVTCYRFKLYVCLKIAPESNCKVLWLCFWRLLIYFNYSYLFLISTCLYETDGVKSIPNIIIFGYIRSFIFFFFSNVSY